MEKADSSPLMDCRDVFFVRTKEERWMDVCLLSEPEESWKKEKPGGQWRRKAADEAAVDLSLGLVGC